MSINRKTPDLSSFASNDFDNDFSDLDDIIEKESGYDGTPDLSDNDNNQDTNFDDFNSNDNDWWENDRTVKSPTQQSNNAPVSKAEDPLIKEMEDILDDAVGGDETENNQKTIGSNENQNSQPPSSEEDPYLLALNLMQEFDLIRLPEDVDYSKIDAETLAQYKDYTVQQHYNEALDEIRSRIQGDPNMLRLFDYAYQGGSFADLPLMADIIQEETDFLQFDIDHPENQKYIVELYLSEGLDERDPRHQKLLQAIPDQVNKLADNLELQQEAINAKRYFVERTREKALMEEQRIMQQLEEQERQRQAELAEAQRWNNAFRETLMKRPWDENKKKAIATEASYVTLQDGSQMPMWQYKQQMILSDPGLFQEFLDFTSRFDPYAGTFIDYSEQQIDHLPQGTLSKIVERLQKKGFKPNSSTGGKNTNYNTNSNSKKLPSVNVKNDWFNG